MTQRTVSGAPPRRPPAILVGAETVNAISIVRSLGVAGVDVHLLCGSRALPALSRYARRVPIEHEDAGQEAWADYLLSARASALRGAVLLACNDDALEFLLEHRDELAEHYLLDLCDPEAQRCMLDKLATYRMAAEVDVPTPRFWAAESEAAVRSRASEYTYPLMIKPLYSHRFKKVMEGKYLMAADLDELLAGYRRASEHDLDVVLLEVIPGDDDQLCSYYTYLDESGTPLFHFTKRIIRRHPEREGFACYHVTDWIPEVRELGLRLFRHAGLKGVANVEFKLDARDGRLKLIECNARFTAANGLVVASGFDLGLFVYNRLAGLPQAPLPSSYRRGMRLWYPMADWLAYRALRSQGRMTRGAWLRSILHRQTLPYFSWRDPWPSIVLFQRMMRGLASERAKAMKKAIGA